jgi:hypothetical protein
MLRLIAGLIAWSISLAASAFMPASGMWQFDSESSGQPGRGFELDVQNEIVFLAYYGYRADGSSLFYVASGQIANNTFTADLLNAQGGTALGGEYKPAALAASPGKVVLSFTSGTHGTIALPGESAKAISKYSFGYTDGPDGLLGTWLFTMIANGIPYSELKVLSAKYGSLSSTGNGYAMTANQNFVCEFQVTGSYAGAVICSVLPATTSSNVYILKIAGDRGTGIGGPSSITLANAYEAHALRTATKTGARTGLNDGTGPTVIVRDAPVIASRTFDVAPISRPDDAERAAALAAWLEEVRALSIP